MSTWFVAVALVLPGADNAVEFDFEDAKVGELPKGWKADKTGEGAGSVWKVIEDATSPQKSHVLAQTSSEGPGPLFNLCIADEPSLRDVEITVSFKAMSGKIDQGGGVVWRYHDAKNYYIARMNPLEDNFRVYKVVNGKRMQLGTAAVDAPAGKWHTLRIVQKGDRVEGFLNGKRYFDVKDGEFKDAGKVGLWTKADAMTAFDGLKVSPPQSDSALP